MITKQHYIIKDTYEEDTIHELVFNKQKNEFLLHIFNYYKCKKKLFKNTNTNTKFRLNYWFKIMSTNS